jgi:hypothetical protein
MTSLQQWQPALSAPVKNNKNKNKERPVQRAGIGPNLNDITEPTTR